MKNPLITRRKYESELNEKDRQIARLIIDHDEELKQTKAQLKDLIPKLVKITIGQHPYDEFKHYRLCVDFSTQMVEQAFIHGNDRKAIQWICEDIGRQLEREMFSINFKRLN